MQIGKSSFDRKGHTYIMGILNVTPDSFSDGGEYTNIDAALFRVQKMIAEGADIIDIGGESTRPGSAPVSVDEEMSRVIPALSKIKSEFNIPISIDTYRSATAEECIKNGADMINDIWGLLYDEKMAGVIAAANKPCCLMHNRKSSDYANFSEDFFTEMAGILTRALKAGISEDNIVLDPGIGFAKDTTQNLYVLNNMDMMNHFDVPWLLGASRKSVIGNTLNLPAGERLEGTLALTALAVMKGASFVRVHDVLENKRVIDMLEAVRNV